ncbi:MAG: sulfotransferase [Proteobacteria bacterium]|nr:sulfotransferase [Pseudomonadota bacterium]
MLSSADPELLLQLAQQDLASGQPGAAQEKCLQVLAAHQHHPGALEVLGTVLSSQGRHEDAVRVFNALTLLEPTVARHWEHLGTVLRPTNRYEQALAAFEQALKLAPPTPGVLYNLGVLQMDRCDYGAAYLALRDGVKLAPADGRIRWAFAQCCFDVFQREEALEALEGWQDLEGLTVEFTVRIILLLGGMAAVDPAEPEVQRLLANPPRQGLAALGCVSILERLSRLDEARAALERLELEDRRAEPDPARRLMSAALAARAGQHEEAYRHLALALKHHEEFVHRHKLLFLFARTCDALGRYEEAYSAAEEAHRSQLQFLERAHDKTLEQSNYWVFTAESCDPGDVGSWGSDGPGVAESPIFIVGFPRSGTTLLEQVLDAHPLLRSMDEQGLVLRALTEIRDRGIHYPTELGKLSARDLEEIRAGYWERARRRAHLLPGQRLVDKAPLNMIFVPVIRRLFPNARIVLAIRHPCDVLLSCYMQHFAAPPLALACRDLETLARVYSRCFSFWYAQWPLLRPSSYELRYEQLTADFPAEVRKLSAFLELPWDDAMLAPGEHARGKFITTPSYAQVVEPVTNRAVGRWRHYAPHFSGEVLATLMPWIERWGYSATWQATFGHPKKDGGLAPAV